MNTSLIKASIKKELWEFKGMLTWVPITLIGLIIAVPLLALLLNDLDGDKFLAGVKQLAELQSSPELQTIFFSSTIALFTPFLVVGFIVQCYYLINCLFDEKRDRSVMFWRSLPVSDGLTVAIKLLTGAIVIPAIFMSAATALFLLGLLVNIVISSVLYFGYDISLFGLLGEINIVSNLSYIWVSLLPTAVWLLPLFSWLMLASIYATKAPFLWAVLPIAALLVIEGIIVNYLQLPDMFFGKFLMDYFSITPSIEHGNSIQAHDSLSIILAQIDYRTVVTSAVLMYAVYWFRVNKSEI
ncbi:ABC transporter permease [Colwellia sp. D2M02]|uniref:ABC transporter permease n=1 Tax=Colwellia sp. D2M02 TaxID=2841562 RepID=UPI001C09CADD|nr:ABC transporter permease [Colwellia sp. D2M02]MBU2893264.1 ABC transporter permease [Colwellia sp. D2M02]